MFDLVDRLEKCIKEEGGNFRRVERECGPGNETVRRWSEQSPCLDKLVIAAGYLQVSLDYLVFGGSASETSTNGDRLDLETEKERGGPTCGGLPLSGDEISLIVMYRFLSPSYHEEVFNLVYFKYKRVVEERRESICSTYFDRSDDGKSDPVESHEARDGTARSFTLV